MIYQVNEKQGISLLMLAHSHHMQLADAGTKQRCLPHERCKSGGRQHIGQSE